MIKFRQKEFIAAATLVNGAFIGTGVIGIGQAAKQSAESKEQAEEQERLLRIQNKKLEKVAEAAKSNPVAGAVAQVKSYSLRVKRFAAPNPGVWKNLTGLGKDIWRTQKGNLGNAAASAVGFGAMGYTGNRIATSMKDHDTGHDEKNKEFLKKAAITAGAIGGGLLAARLGGLGKTAQTWTKNNINTKTIGSALNPTKIKENGKRGVDWGKAAKVGGFGFFAGIPVLGYLGQRKQIKEQAAQSAANQENQRQYSTEEDYKRKKSSLLKGLAATGAVVGTVAAGKYGFLGGKVQRFVGKSQAGIGGLMRSSGMKTAGDKMAKSGSETWTKGLMRRDGMTEAAAKASGAKMYKNANASAVGKEMAEGFSKFGHTWGIWGKSGGGTEAVQRSAQSLGYGKGASGSNWSKAISDWTSKHKTATNVLAGAGTLGVGAGIMFPAGDLPYKIWDKRAYDQQKDNNQTVQ